MRDIRFRAWDKVSKTMSPASTLNQLLTSATRLGITLDGSMVLMQYTGLKDKNGVEIYESDLLKTDTFGHTDSTFRVEYLEYRAAFKAIDRHNDGYHLDDMQWEVIGNVWENPELLKEDNHGE